MSQIKIIFKKIIGKYNLKKLSYAKALRNKYKLSSDNISIMKILRKTKVIKIKDLKGREIKELFENIEIGNLDNIKKFYYYIDIFKTLCIENSIIGNLTIDYSKILEMSLNDYRKKLENINMQTAFYKNEIITIEAIEDLITKTTQKLNLQPNCKEIVENLERIKKQKANGFKEALQRILFLNQLLWQTGHYLNGLGRLDMILESYYKKDIKSKIITKDEAKDSLREFLLILHKDYYFKSNNLAGDTGQIIELGGLNSNGKYICNDLTYIFIELMEELMLPDPKILLRVSKYMPRDLMCNSLKCIKTGIGCPLLANDDIIIPKLIKFGYEKEDAYNYATSACWEPYIIGNALDQNNLKSIVFIQPFETMLENEDLQRIKSTEELIEMYFQYLEIYLKNLIKGLENVKFEEDPLLSLFFNNCIESNIDISKGGAKYNNYGLTGVGLSNLVNSIISVKNIVFTKHTITLEDFNKKKIENFNKNKELLKQIKNDKERYGADNNQIIELTNKIIKKTSEIVLKYNNQFGGKYKFGLSAPSYIDSSKEFPASFDGRKNGEPFGVHISYDSVNSYTELIQFASKLDYGENRFNGNVVDFLVSPNFIEDNFEKFVDFLMLSIKVGFFEMQMNVVSSKKLIEARKNPEEFPDLIVRVWGFSAYFKDLPDKYKDYIIERALKSEGNC